MIVLIISIIFFIILWTIISEQSQAEKRERFLRENIDDMEGHRFELWCAALLESYGFTGVQVTRGSGDQGVDVLAQKDGHRYAIQCKRYNSSLGNKPVQEVFTGMQLYHCDIGVVMTNSYFTAGAKTAASATGVLLWDRTVIAKMFEEVNKASETKRQKRESERQADNKTAQQSQTDEKHKGSPLVWIVVIVASIGIVGSSILIMQTKFDTVSEKQTAADETTRGIESTSIEKLLNKSPIPTLERFGFDMTRDEVGEIAQRLNIPLEYSEDNVGNYYIRNIVAAPNYPVRNAKWDVCAYDFGFPDSFQYLNHDIDMLSLYYVYDPVDGQVKRESGNAKLYAIKLLILTEMPGDIFQSMRAELEAAFGQCSWQGTDPSQMFGNDGVEENTQERQYCVWKPKKPDMLVALSGNASLNNGSVNEIEVSVINNKANTLIKRIIEEVKDDSAA